MIGWATTRIDILRDADTADRDGFGDETETPGTPVESDVPASILERTQRLASEGFRPVTYTVGRIGGQYDVQVGDRIFDRRTGTYYGVSLVKRQQSGILVGDTRLELVTS